jgi:hypothetical protein
LQRTGASVIRNELTTRRARLEPGEAEYLPGGDPFLRYAVGSDPSIIWVVELLPADNAATPATGTALFTSDAITDYPTGTFAIDLRRDVLLPGEVDTLPPHTGPELVVITSGTVQAAADGGPAAPLSAASSRLVTGQLTLRNSDSQPAAFVVAALGEPVDGAEQPAVTPTPVPTQQVPTEVLAPVDAAPTAAPQEQAAEPTAVPAAPDESAASGQATIRVIAEGDIQVTITADGVVVFSGWLGAGGSTDWYTANQFAVTTTDGSLTLFENADTGQQFYMGYGPNETYYLGG